MAFWGVYVKPEEPYTLKPDSQGRRLRITQATLGEQCEVEIPWSVLQCAVGNKPPISVCSLSMKEGLSSPLNLEFEELEDVVFSVVGSQGVYLAGCYLAQCATCRTVCDGANGFIIKYYDRKTSEEEENVEGKKLGTTEGAENEKGKITEAVENEEDKKLCTTEETEKEKDKNMTTTEVEKEENNMLSAIEEDIGDVDSFSNGSVYPSEENSYDLNDSFIDDSGLSVQPSMQELLGVDVNEKPKSWKSSSKRLNKNHSTESDGIRRQQKRKTAKTSSSGVQGGAEYKRGSDGTLGRGEKDKLNHLTIIREPQGLVGTGGVDANFDLKTHECQSEDKESRRKKKKKKKTEKKKDDFSGEIVIQELAKGKPDGKMAAQGRKVKIMYTAWIKESGKVIDSNIGQAPIKFQLGTRSALSLSLIGDEEIIKGWNVGVEGMRVGDKRRLFLPPFMGSWRMDERTIPPNSCLVYDIELVGVH